MPNAVYWEVLPGTDLANIESWHKIAKDRYFASRVQLMIVKRELDGYRDGTVIASHPVSKDTIEIGVKRQLITSRTDTIQAALRFSTTERVLDQLSSKISAELSVKVPGYSGQLGSSIMSKEEYELTKTTETSLGSTSSFFIQDSTEQEHKITLNPGDIERTAKLRIRYLPRRWDVYLYSYEALELTYKRDIPFVWNRLRNTMKTAELQVVGWPLVSILYWEPQTEQVVTYDPVPDPLEFPDTIKVEDPVDPMPDFAPAPIKSLEAFAKLAFPVSKEEKIEAKKYKRPPEAKKKAAKKAYGRIAAAKKRKKTAAKKGVRRKSTARKSATKKSARKRKR